MLLSSNKELLSTSIVPSLWPAGGRYGAELTLTGLVRFPAGHPLDGHPRLRENLLWSTGRPPAASARSSGWEGTQPRGGTGEPDVDMQNQQGTVT